MTLSLVFRIQALVFAFFGVYATWQCQPTMMESFGVGQSANAMAGVLAKSCPLWFWLWLMSKLADA